METETTEMTLKQINLFAKTSIRHFINSLDKYIVCGDGEEVIVLKKGSKEYIVIDCEDGSTVKNIILAVKQLEENK